MKGLSVKNSTVSIPVDAVRRVLPFAPTIDYRPGLLGVHAMPDGQGGVLVMACDGASLLCTRAVNGKTDRAVTLPFTPRRNKAGLNGADSIEVAPDGTVWTRSGSSVPHFICPDGLVDGKFPDVEGLVGDATEWRPGLAGTFSIALLVGRIAAKGGITFYQHAAKQATLFVVDGDTFGLIMPMRTDPKPLAEVVPALFRKVVPA